MILLKSQERVVLDRVTTIGVIMSLVVVEQNESYPQLIFMTLVQPKKGTTANVNIKIDSRNLSCRMFMTNIIHYLRLR